MADFPPPLAHLSSLAWRDGGSQQTLRALPEETPVALSYEHASFAVMMATPADLQDFAIGFSISEGIISEISDITALEIVNLEAGIECRMSLAPARRDALAARRRHLAGPVGCGLCGLDSLAEAGRTPAPVNSATRISAKAIATAMAGMASLQSLNQATRAVHAAAFFNPETTSLLLREDIGRHNALDKLIGAARKTAVPAGAGAVLLTSRVSVDLIQKTAMFGAAILAAISVPSALAVRAAEAAGITLIAVARDDGFEIFTHAERIILDAR